MFTFYIHSLPCQFKSRKKPRITAFSQLPTERTHIFLCFQTCNWQLCWHCAAFLPVCSSVIFFKGFSKKIFQTALSSAALPKIYFFLLLQKVKALGDLFFFWTKICQYEKVSSKGGSSGGIFFTFNFFTFRVSMCVFSHLFYDVFFFTWKGPVICLGALCSFSRSFWYVTCPSLPRIHALDPQLHQGAIEAVCVKSPLLLLGHWCTCKVCHNIPDRPPAAPGGCLIIQGV